ncbi:MAG: hypothetical protein IH960_14350 [Chloroflexi bacterium]|nr:hypothetical protein [Chloroflexota bacterium]
MATQKASKNMPYGRRAAKALLLLVLLFISIVGLSAPAAAEHGAGGGSTYSFLDTGFSQDLVGTSNHVVGDLAWARDNDLFVNDCLFFESELHRFDMQSATGAINGTDLHPVSIVASDAGCGMINHPNGKIYSNTTLGVVEIDAVTGAATALPPFGAAGRAFGITVHPKNDDIIYVGSSNEILRVAIGGASSLYSLANAGDTVSEIVFDSYGLLYLAVREGENRITVVNSDGSKNRDIILTSTPFGMAYHETANFMVTMNDDGTITKIDLDSGDAISLFAGGEVGHFMSTVGPDGCLYNTRLFGTTYDDLTTTGESSVVRICDIVGDGFTPHAAPPTGETTVDLDVHPMSCPNPVSSKSHGKTPIAILGTNSFDVNDIDVATINISGLSPLRSSIEDVATPWGGSASDPVSRDDCGTDGPDGHDDLTLKFNTQELIAAIGPVEKGDVVVVTIEAELIGGGAITASDVIWIK